MKTLVSVKSSFEDYLKEAEAALKQQVTPSIISKVKQELTLKRLEAIDNCMIVAFKHKLNNPE